MAGRLRPRGRAEVRARRLRDHAVSRPAEAVVRASSSAWRRVLDALWPVAQSALAATLAWLIAHDVLGHPQPFFAPIAGAISLSTSPIQRSRRIAQMVAGVLLGIGVAELMQPLLGESTAALGLTVLVTMAVALAAGASFFGDGMMFPNQAAASAVLVITLHRHGTGAERAVDAVIGGGCALLIGVGLFPADPLTLLRDAERSVLSILAERLGHVGAELSSGRRPDAGWTLSTGHEIHRRLGALTRARSTARINVRVAPRRWRRRRAVDAENLRTAQLDLLANAVISLIRSVTRPDEAQAPPDPALVSEITVMAGALRWLAEAERPWSETILRETETVARDALTRAGARGIDRAEVSAAILRAVAGDLIAVLAPPPEPPMSEQ